MPTYVYKREDGSTFELEQRISEDALTTCPTTGQKVSRVISGGTGLIFKGSGFYLTDYARAKKGKQDASESRGTKSESAPSAAAKTENKSSTESSKKESSKTSGSSSESKSD
ncbi:MAG: zinc ribbon domain-containing protein [Rhodothermales bacterium]|nr:zinc ribbon domain-containing protein [Rhodothermales bacterium]